MKRSDITSRSDLDICILLCDSGIDIDITDSECSTPLITACKILHVKNRIVDWGEPNENIIKIINYLLDNGSNINHQNNLNNTPLIELCRSCVESQLYIREVNMVIIIKIVDLLLERGASVILKNNNGQTAYDILDQFSFKSLNPGINLILRKLNPKPSLFKRMYNGFSEVLLGSNEAHSFVNNNLGGVLPL